MAVVDAIEAMIKGRPYKKKQSVSEAVNELKKNSGTQFDPKIVAIFMKLYQEGKIRQKNQEPND